jgi:hypothetical protein
MAAEQSSDQLDPKAMQAKIQAQAEFTGQRMQAMLPFQSSGWLERMFGPFMDTNRARIPQADGQGSSGTFLQVWLERKGTKTEAESPIRLLATTVELRDIESGRADVMTGEAIASMDAETGFDLPQALGTPQDETLARLYEIDGYVTEIAKVQPPRRTGGPESGGVRHTVPTT